MLDFELGETVFYNGEEAKVIKILKRKGRILIEFTEIKGKVWCSIGEFNI